MFCIYSSVLDHFNQQFSDKVLSNLERACILLESVLVVRTFSNSTLLLLASDLDFHLLCYYYESVLKLVHTFLKPLFSQDPCLSLVLILSETILVYLYPKITVKLELL